MICWDRLGDDVVIGVLEGGEPAALRDLFTRVRDLVAPEHAATSTDPALARILQVRRAREHGEPPLWPDDEVFDTARTMLDLALSTIPDEGAVAVLPSFNHVFAWLWAITDVTAASPRDARWLGDVARALHATASAERAHRVDHFW
ncbi:hypothetical protein [Umezawaea sp.]|uniref:DUF2017 family protein n=1 Tax=Umezawaea sp. TaxID=1955258 RepID=UPI002ED69CB3